MFILVLLASYLSLFPWVISTCVCGCTHILISGCNYSCEFQGTICNFLLDLRVNISNQLCLQPSSTPHPAFHEKRLKHLLFCPGRSPGSCHQLLILLILAQKWLLRPAISPHLNGCGPCWVLIISPWICCCRDFPRLLNSILSSVIHPL